MEQKGRERLRDNQIRWRRRQEHLRWGRGPVEKGRMKVDLELEEGLLNLLGFRRKGMRKGFDGDKPWVQAQS